MRRLRMPALSFGVLATTATAQAAEPFSDSFTKDLSLRSGWILSLPNPASRYAIGPQGLMLEASGENGGSDLWLGTNFKASLLLQPISPTANWTIVTRLLFSPEIDFQAAGIILTKEIDGFTRASRFHRFELSYQNGHHGLAVSSYLNGPIDPRFVPYPGGEIYLMLRKNGSTYDYSYSPDGTGWTLVSTLIDTSTYCYVGLDALRQPWHDRVNLPSQPVFKYFKIDAKDSGDGGGCTGPIARNDEPARAG
jgi:hypothetical protein